MLIGKILCLFKMALAQNGRSISWKTNASEGRWSASVVKDSPPIRSRINPAKALATSHRYSFKTCHTCVFNLVSKYVF